MSEGGRGRDLGRRSRLGSGLMSRPRGRLVAGRKSPCWPPTCSAPMLQSARHGHYVRLFAIAGAPYRHHTCCTSMSSVSPQRTASYARRSKLAGHHRRDSAAFGSFGQRWPAGRRATEARATRTSRASRWPSSLRKSRLDTSTESGLRPRCDTTADAAMARRAHDRRRQTT